MILNKSQAKAVYDAMCALNNVGARLEANFQGAIARETVDGRITIYIVPNTTFPQSHAAELEIYPDQSAFATAYGME